MITAIAPSGKKYAIENKNGVIHIDGKAMQVDQLMIKPGTFHWLINNKSYRIELVEHQSKKYVLNVNGKIFTIDLKDKMDDLLHALGMDNLSAQKVTDLKAPMPGLVVGVMVEEGQKIKKGDTIIVLEAMKMENALKATSDATVKKIAVGKGAAVEKNAVLVYFE